MLLDKICAPALLYIAFSIIQIIIDIFKRMYNTAFLKFIVMIIFSLALNFLCNKGLGVISWFIVFVPFIMMTVVTTILLYVFGLDPQSGKINNPRHLHGRHKRKLTPHRHHHLHKKCKKKKLGCRNPNCPSPNCPNCNKE
tara:strand:- start:971 stop:1390 length:420 start_codon:yes stop_codon:yes gene_type:complete